MRNIKLSFEHPCYIYPFKVSLINLAHSNEIERINYKQTEEKIEKIKHEVILSEEEEKVLSSLSIGKYIP